MVRFRGLGLGAGLGGLLPVPEIQYLSYLHSAIDQLRGEAATMQFLSVGAYALIWGWRFAVGFVLLILVHEAGHYLEARRQGLHPSLPVFVPFLGAYVAIKDSPFDPWRNFLVSIAGLRDQTRLALGEGMFDIESCRVIRDGA